MGCDMFDHQAQNKRYLGDLVQKLVAEAKVCISPERFSHHTFAAGHTDLYPW